MTSRVTIVVGIYADVLQFAKTVPIVTECILDSVELSSKPEIGYVLGVTIAELVKLERANKGPVSCQHHFA